jgi:hypothetical protein
MEKLERIRANFDAARARGEYVPEPSPERMEELRARFKARFGRDVLAPRRRENV